MPDKRTAIVVVRKDWVNDCAFLVNRGRGSSSAADTHVLISPVEDLSDARGLWLAGIESNQLTTDQSTVPMKLMIPWSVIIAVGIVEGDDASKLVGFAPRPAV
jgi:hypothetical protein